MENGLDLFLQNQGLQHIAGKILSYLDYQSLINCQIVNKQWYQFMIENYD